MAVRSYHGISVKCSQYQDTGPTDPSLHNTNTEIQPPSAKDQPQVVSTKSFSKKQSWKQSCLFFLSKEGGPKYPRQAFGIRNISCKFQKPRFETFTQESDYESVSPWYDLAMSLD